MRWLIIALVLSGCSDLKEVRDQGGHLLFGYSMACKLARAGDDNIVDKVMQVAKAREEQQHPGVCKEGCQRDLKYWKIGAKAGAKCE